MNDIVITEICIKKEDIKDKELGVLLFCYIVLKKTVKTQNLYLSYPFQKHTVLHTSTEIIAHFIFSCSWMCLYSDFPQISSKNEENVYEENT